MARLKILQLFSRYLQYGGEEGIVYRTGDALQSIHDVDYFIASTEELLQQPRLAIPALTYRNFPVLKRLVEHQRQGGFDFWQIHNVFPAISPGAYTLAKKLDMPIVHYLHNYRMGCVNGFAFTQGEDCHKCSQGNFISGVTGKCWRGSLAQSTAMALIMTDVRRRGLFSQVRRWIAISHAQKEYHVKMGIPSDKIDVVLHFLECDATVEIPPFPDHGYGLFIGRLSPEKGVDRLLEAWALLGANRKLVIAGDGPEDASLRSRAAALGLNNVIFTGFVGQAEQKELWAGAAFSIVPSRWQEPFGMVVLEAWRQGRPVVAHRIGALPEIVTHERDGFLADAADASSLATAIERAFCAGKNLPEMGRNGMEQLRNFYHKDRWLADIQQVYRNAGLL